MDIHQSVDNAHGGATDADFPTSMIQFNPFIPTTVNHDTLNVFIRESYRSYYGHIREAFALDYRMITLTGTSGIGLSCFYSYFFDRFRAENRATTIIAASFNAERELISCLEFPPGSLNGVERSEIPTNKEALYLYDGAPHVGHWTRRMVCFTTPDPSWRRTLYKDPSHCELYLPVWTLKELTAAAADLGLPLDPKTIQARFRFFGGSARYCLGLHDVDPVIASIRGTLAGFSVDQLEMCLAGDPRTQHIRHHVFHAAPVFLRSPLPYFRNVFIASDEIREILEKILVNSDDASFSAFVRARPPTHETPVLLDWLFGVHVLRLFSKGNEKFDLSRLSNSGDRATLVLQSGVFERICGSNIPTVDGAFRDATSGITYLFQITRSDSHQVNGFGTWALLKERGELESLRQNKVALVFAVPESREGFGHQSIEIPEFPLGQATQISSIPGLDPADCFELFGKGIGTAKDLRGQLSEDLSLERYRSRLGTFEQWYNSSDASLSLVSIPQFRLTIPNIFDKF